MSHSAQQTDAATSTAEVDARYATAVRQEQLGNAEGAVTGYREVLELHPSSTAARRSLALLLVRMGRSHEAVPLFRAEIAAGDEGVAWMTTAVVAAMQADDLRPAGELARIFSSIRYGAHRDGANDPSLLPEPKLSVGKLRHDADQLRHLRSKGIVGEELNQVIAGYVDVAKRLEAAGHDIRVPLSQIGDERISGVYGRILNLRETPRLDRALSDTWDSDGAEDAYLNQRPSVVVIDDVLTREALESLQEFCLESTVWLANRYPHGRLGAFFLDGFNCPLLLQIAEELRHRLPRLIGSRHTLRQLWGFKSPPQLPADSTVHADFAAVNVNFWIMPERGNLDPASGGLLVYDCAAPLSWDFKSYNERLDLIKGFLQRHQPRAIKIPYRENRAIIFDSDLFHATDELNFRPEFEFRRVNITMLYGMREHDEHHAEPSVPSPTVQPSPMDATPAWRSAAFSRSRRR